MPNAARITLAMKAMLICFTKRGNSSFFQRMYCVTATSSETMMANGTCQRL